MSTTSEHGGYIRGFIATAAGELDEAKPVDTAAVRDGLINNLNHLQDSEGQVLINFLRPFGSYDVTSPADTLNFRRIESLPPMQITPRLRHDGESLRLVVELRASISAAGTAEFRVFLRVPIVGVSGTAPPPDPSLGFVNVADASTTSTTGADISFAPLYITRAGVAAAYFDEVQSERGDGDAESAFEMRAHLEVWARSSVSTSLPRIHSIMVREYIGKV
jgi:hypothetical protein